MLMLYVDATGQGVHVSLPTGVALSGSSSWGKGDGMNGAFSSFDGCRGWHPQPRKTMTRRVIRRESNRTAGSWGLLSSLVVALAVAGCTSDEQPLVLVDLQTMCRPGVDFHSVAVAVTPEVGPTIQESRLVSASDDFIGGARVAEVALVSSGLTVVTLSLHHADGSLVASGVASELVDGATGVIVQVTDGCMGPLDGGPSDAATPDGTMPDAARDTSTSDVQPEGAVDSGVDGGTDADADGADSSLVCTGIREVDVCCPTTCGACGGTGCEARPGGPDECCRLDVYYSERSCRDFPPPCVLLSPAPTDPCTGIQDDTLCCPTSCGTCGGAGCNTRPGGAANCCGSDIRASGRDCAAFPPPCNIAVPWM